jgi:hypothetical protein
MGIKSGYSIDTYKISNTKNDYTFNHLNNSITSNTSDFTSLTYGAVIEIAGSRSNDARYNVNNNSENTIIVQGYPRIVENGVLSNPSVSNFVLGGSEVFYINYSVTTNINFYSGKIIINYNDSSTTDNAYNLIQNATHFTISGSNFNNGVKLINYYTISGFSFGITKTSSTQITILTIQNNYSEINNNNVTLTINNIANNNLLSNLVNNSFNNNIFSSDSLYIQYGNKSCKYKISKSRLLFFKYSRDSFTSFKKWDELISKSSSNIIAYS